jgi:hypothetical protein
MQAVFVDGLVAFAASSFETRSVGALLRMRAIIATRALMVRSAAERRVSNHERREGRNWI